LLVELVVVEVLQEVPQLIQVVEEVQGVIEPLVMDQVLRKVVV
jgi:hypothetical protein